MMRFFLRGFSTQHLCYHGGLYRQIEKSNKPPCAKSAFTFNQENRELALQRAHPQPRNGSGKDFANAPSLTSRWHTSMVDKGDAGCRVTLKRNPTISADLLLRRGN
jgi:hypothetical protein